MPNPSVGQDERLSITWTAAGGQFYDPTKVRISCQTITLKGPFGAPTVFEYPSDPSVIRDDVGQFHFDIGFAYDGILAYRWEALNGSDVTLATFDGETYLYPSRFRPAALTDFPFSTGYCHVGDVVARVAAGSWDPSAVDAFPTAAQVAQLCIEASAEVDAVLARAGYDVPLAVIPGFPGGVILPQAWTLLRDAAAALATSRVEMTRHGSNDQSADKSAEGWAKLATDMLGRLGDGSDNLVIFGAIGPFAAELDPGKALQSGNLIFDTTAEQLRDYSGTAAIDTFHRDIRF